MNKERMVKLVCFLFLTIQLASNLWAQKYTYFEADFTIKEKNTTIEKYILMMGKVSFDNGNDRTEYHINFPQKQKWIVIDSFITKYENDSIFETKKIGNINDLSVFKGILEFKDQDGGLSKHGFVISSVEETEEGLLIYWTPPVGFDKFVKHVKTVVDDNLLQAMIITDVNDIEISKMFYEDYQIIDELPIPHKISSHTINTSKSEELFKSITFRNVKIN